MNTITQISANFKVQVSLREETKTIYGSVKFKNDKFSISIQDRNYYRSYYVSMAETIVKDSFKEYKNSPIFYNIVETSKNIVDELRVATQELKATYMIKTIETAERMFNHATEFLPIRREERAIVYKELGYNNYDYSRLTKEINKMLDITYDGYAKFLSKELKHAESHYESSLYKLADRLTIKGISENYKIESGYVGVNFEVTISHELGNVKAWTIIAEGPYVRAHYRYLIK
jgi:hypothetical protein